MTGLAEAGFFAPGGTHRAGQAELFIFIVHFRKYAYMQFFLTHEQFLQNGPA